MASFLGRGGIARIKHRTGIAVFGPEIAPPSSIVPAVDIDSPSLFVSTMTSSILELAFEHEIGTPDSAGTTCVRSGLCSMSAAGYVQRARGRVDREDVRLHIDDLHVYIHCGACVVKAAK